jgi:hypothetical protein
VKGTTMSTPTPTTTPPPSDPAATLKTAEAQLEHTVASLKASPHKGTFAALIAKIEEAIFHAKHATPHAATTTTPAP